MEDGIFVFYTLQHRYIGKVDKHDGKGVIDCPSGWRDTELNHFMPSRMAGDHEVWANTLQHGWWKEADALKALAHVNEKESGSNRGLGGWHEFRMIRKVVAQKTEVI